MTIAEKSSLRFLNIGRITYEIKLYS
jgi:hypothetical protein